MRLKLTTAGGQGRPTCRVVNYAGQFTLRKGARLAERLHLLGPLRVRLLNLPPQPLDLRRLRLHRLHLLPRAPLQLPKPLPRGAELSLCLQPAAVALRLLELRNAVVSL